MIEVYTDGACEPVNPGGTAAYGVYIRKLGSDGRSTRWMELLRESRVFFPIPGRERDTSNNVAEYSGFLRALEWLEDRGLNEDRILYRSDSQLVIYQNSVDPRYGHKWQMKRGFYLPIAKRAQRMLEKFPYLTMEWIPREENTLADELSKDELVRVGVKFRIQPRG